MRRAFVGLALFAIAPSVHAVEKAECVRSHVAGQERRLEGKLLEAQREFRICARAGCPEVVARQCVPWLQELEQRIPTVVIAIQDQTGADVRGTTVLLDSQPWPEARTGRAVALDPGEHVVAVRGDGFESVSQRVMVREGDRARRITLRVATRTQAEPAPRDQAEPSGSPVIAYVLGAVGIAALATGGYLFVTARSDAQELRDECAPHCGESEVDDVRTRLRWATVAGAIGVVSLGAGGYFLIAGAGSPSGAQGLRIGVGGTF